VSLLEKGEDLLLLGSVLVSGSRYSCLVKALNKVVDSEHVVKSIPLWLWTCPMAVRYPLMEMDRSFFSSHRKMKKVVIRGGEA